MRRRVAIAAGAVVIGLLAIAIVLWASFASTYELRGPNDHVAVGWPVHWAHTEVAISPPRYPWRTTVNPWEDPTTGDGHRFWLAWAVVAVPLELVYLALLSVRRSTRR